MAAESLPRLLRDALAQHPSLRSHVALRGVAEAGVDAAKWQFYPTPSVAVERAAVSGGDPSYSGDKQVATLRLQQPLWTGGRLSGNLEKAEASVVLAQTDLEIGRQQLALRVIQAWSEATTAQFKLDALDQSRATHARLLALVQRRAQEGVSAQADVELAQSRLDAVDAEVFSTRAQRDSALDKLRLLTGRALDIGALDGNAAVPLSAQALGPLLHAARDISPQLGKVRAQAKVAEAGITLARAALQPEVYVRAERQYGNFSNAGAASETRVFVGVSTAFGAGLSSLSGVAAAQAQLQAAQDDLLAQQLALDEQIQSDFTLFLSAGVRRQSLARAREAAAGVSSSWERQFLAGRKQWQDLMNAAREQAQSDAQLADAIGAQQLTGWRLKTLTAGVDAVLADSLQGPQQ